MWTSQRLLHEPGGDLSGRRSFAIGWTARALFAAVALAAILAAPQARADAPAQPGATPAEPSHPRDASRDDYRKHLSELATLVGACAKARDKKTCDPAQVGPDDQAPLTENANAERRLVRYEWLRVLLSKAQEKDTVEPEAKLAPAAKAAPEEKAIRPPKRTTTELLQDAETRLARDLAQADAATVAAPAHDRERGAMKQVLAAPEFRTLEEHAARDSLWEKLGNWLNWLFESFAKLTARAAWVGRVIEWGFLLAVCVGLVWGLLQFERRWRIRLMPENMGPAAGAASSIHWQIWLRDARQAAADGKWREAVHFVYWAAISRLESKRLWPADRARTPREYLALVAPDDPRRAGLATLTGSFERIWYGGRAAVETDYRTAEQLAEGLISGSAASPVGVQGGAAQ
jgi:hypothetical protein